MSHVFKRVGFLTVHPQRWRGDEDLDSSTSREHATEIVGRPPYGGLEAQLFQQTGKNQGANGGFLDTS